MSKALTRDVEVNGARLRYLEQGSGEPIVFVHGAFSDHRVWDPVKEGFAKRYRFIAFTQRYFGTNPWPDDGKGFCVATHTEDLANFIASIDASPAHLIGRSYGGGVAVAAALKYPSLVRTLTVHEPALPSLLQPTSPEGKAAREDRMKFVSSAAAAAKAGDLIRAVRLFCEGVYQLGPGGFEQLPKATQTMILNNARTAPLLFGSSPPAITCDALKVFAGPMLVTHGEKTHVYYKLINEGLGKCLPRARRVGFPNLCHDAPSRDPAAFIGAVIEFLSQH